MDRRAFILGIDAGTRRIKVLIADDQAQQVGFGSVVTETVSPQHGYVEQDARSIWNTPTTW